MFQLGSAEPTEKAREILASVAEVIREQDAKIAIEGHTDAAPFRGDQITNWELSTNRASAARRMLETNGLDPSRVARVVGYADTELLIKDQPKDPQNRRISIILLQPKDGPPVAQGLKKDVRTSFQQPQPGQQAQPGTSEPAVEAAADRENAMKQSFQEKKVEMKKKKRDVVGLWD
jgi:hypothetical protein